jgi:hypothetical protein
MASAPPSWCGCSGTTVDFEQGKLHVNRAKNGSPSVHPLAGVELRALRRLKRESAESPFVFVCERGALLFVDDASPSHEEARWFMFLKPI